VGAATAIFNERVADLCVMRGSRTRIYIYSRDLSGYFRRAAGKTLVELASVQPTNRCGQELSAPPAQRGNGKEG